MPLTGRLWWRREACWGLEVNGQLQPPASSVTLIGATVRTAVKLDGGHSELPSGPAAVIEFEAEAVRVIRPDGTERTETDDAICVKRADPSEPANDNSEEAS